MDYTCFTVPVLPGQTTAARAFMDELAGARQQQYATSAQRLGIVREVWALQATPHGDLCVVYIESPDLGAAFQRFAASQDEFDQWFKQQVLAVTGADLNTPPAAPLSDVLSIYVA